MRYLIALTGGMITFISPCVLPLVPVYIAYISGISVSDLESGGKNKPMHRIFINTLAFVAGFSIVFSLLAALLFIFLQFLGPYKEWFNRIAGLVIIIFGLQMAGLLKFKFLSGEVRFSPSVRKISPGSSFIIGAAFGGGWTPCVGPVLSSILITSTAGTGWTGGAVSIVLSCFFRRAGSAVYFNRPPHGEAFLDIRRREKALQGNRNNQRDFPCRARGDAGGRLDGICIGAVFKNYPGQRRVTE